MKKKLKSRIDKLQNIPFIANLTTSQAQQGTL
jgi:hypothetical protein